LYRVIVIQKTLSNFVHIASDFQESNPCIQNYMQRRLLKNHVSVESQKTAVSSTP
jgi:hypothetical protein